MKYKINLLQFAAVILLAGCSPDIADMEEDLREEIEDAFQNKSVEQIFALHNFQDEPQEAIEQMKGRWNSRLDREIDSIVFEAIPDEIRNSYSVGYEMDGKWYKLVPSPYKSVVIKYKKKEEVTEGSHGGVAIRKLVSMDGNKIVFPGMKLMDTVPKPLKIVLPDNFIGKFSVVWLESGTIPTETNNSILYEIPKGGELEVASLDHFMQDRPVIVAYKNGAVIFEDNADKTDADGIYYDPNSKSMTTGRIGAPAGTSSSKYFGTKLSWEIKRSEP